MDANVSVRQNTAVETVSAAQKSAAHSWQYNEKPVYEFFKRCFDIVASLCGIIFLSPLFLIVAIIIMADDFGNPFFVQERTGKSGKHFKMLKFRSMYKDAEKRRDELLAQNEADGPIFKIDNDPRITKIGHFIRKTSIDELPQLFNVLIGDMSVIGPRPFPVKEQDACTEYQSKRLAVTPGLSCYAALDRKSHDDFDRWIELDFKYIRERSFFTDLKIIFSTISVVFHSRNS